MTGVDTNVLVRYLVQDDPRQSALATAFLESRTSDDPGYLSHITLCELVWVLQSCYGQERAEIRAVVDRLLRVSQLQVESPAIVRQALDDHASGRADFSDHLMARTNLAAGCSATVTFDRQAGRAPGFRKLD